MNYFEAKVKYTNEEGKNVSEAYLVDAMTLTEMEARTIKELGPVKVISGKESTITDVYPNDAGDRWFKAKVTFEDCDDKKVTNYMLVGARNVDGAYAFLIEKLSSWVMPFEIPSVSESNIIDVFNCF